MTDSNKGLTKNDLAGVGIWIDGGVYGLDGRLQVDLKPEAVTIDVDKLAALGMRAIRVEFMPATAYESGFCSEEITLSWTEVQP